MAKDYQIFVHEYFYQIVATHLSDVALILSTEQLTYAELNQRSNQLAHFLLSKNLKPEDRVVIVLEKSIDFFVSLLAVLKSGCAFVLIEIPQIQDVQNDRFKSCLEGARAQEHGFCILTQSKHQGLLGSYVEQTIYLDDLHTAAAIGKCATDNILAESVGLSFESLAYITFTSGSSGFPKGPMIEHDALFARFMAHQELLHLNANDKVAQFAPVHIDACIMELLMAWMVGATLVIVPPQLSSQQLKHYYRQQGITVSIFTPSVLSGFSPEEFPALRAILTTGEEVSAELLRLWSADGRIAINGYGPSETTIGATLWLYSGVDSVSIGKSMLGTEVCILPVATAENPFDPGQLQTVPEDQSGEICMIGAGVARGYCNDPEQTRQRFFTLADGRRLYRSGDCGSFKEGLFYIAGRLDRQLKKYGRLIVPMEVESAIKSFAWNGVTVQHVLFDKEKTTGLLIARLKLDSSGILSREEVQYFVTALAARLTENLDRFLYPQRWWIDQGDGLVGNWKMQLKDIPWTELYIAHANSALGCIDVVGGVNSEDVLTKLKTIWRQLLCTEVESSFEKQFHIGEDDNFYLIGGDSLVYKKMVACFSEAFPTVPFPVQGFSRQPTIQYLSTIIHMSGLQRRELIDLNHMPPAAQLLPVHFIHPLLGDASGVYSLIAAALARPAFGISARTLSDPHIPADLTLIASDYMADIEAKHQPPYVVVGWSAGGVILHEMVRQWRERNVPVLSIMFDSVSPRYMQTVLQIKEHAKYIADMVRETYKVLYSDVGDEQVRQLSQMLVTEIQKAVSKLAQITIGFGCLRKFISQRPHKSVQDLDGILRTAETIVTAILLHSGDHYLTEDQILVVAKDQFGKIDNHLGWLVNPQHQVRVLPVDGNHLSLVSGENAEIPMVYLLQQHLPRLQNRFQLKEFLLRLHEKYTEHYISFMSFLSAQNVSIPIISIRQSFVDGQSGNPISLEQFFKIMMQNNVGNGFCVKLNSSFYSTHIVYADIIRSYLAGHLQSEYDLVVWIDITSQSEPFFKQSYRHFGEMIYNIAPSGRRADVDSSIKDLEDLIRTTPGNVLVLVENAGRLLDQSKSKEAIVRLCCQKGICVISDFSFREFRITHQFDNLVVIADQDKRRLDTHLRRPYDEDGIKSKQVSLAESLLPRVESSAEKFAGPSLDINELCQSLSQGAQLNAQSMDVFVFEHSFRRETGVIREVSSIKSDVRRTMASSDFVPREGFSLQEVSDRLCAIPKKLKIILIRGVAGSGKTELAYHISESIFPDLIECNTLLWFRFNEKGELDGNALKNLKITQGTPVEMAEECRTQLKSRGPVILVFDDLQKFGSVKDYVNLEETSGVIFITTRNTQLACPGGVVDWEIDLSQGFTEDESVNFLNRVTTLDDRINAIALAKALDKLPLSLHIAGSYIKELLSEGECYQTYLEKLQGSPGSAAADFDKDQQFFWEQLDGSLLSGRPPLFKSVITLTFSKLTAEALKLLYFFAVLADRNIPSDLFDIYCEMLGLRRAEKIKAIGQLHQYGLIWKDATSKEVFYYFHIHQQTQHFAKRDLKNNSDMLVIVKTIAGSLKSMLSEQWSRLQLNRKDNIVLHSDRFLFFLSEILPDQQDMQFNELAQLNKQARAELMSMFSKLGRLDRVLLMCDSLLDADSESVDARLLRADVFTQQEKYDLALQDLDVILIKNERHKNALLQKAIVFSKWGRKLEARDILVKTRCQAKDPVHYIVTYLKIYNSLGMPAKALSVLEGLEYDGLKPDIDIQCIKAILLYHVGRSDEAEKSFQKILAAAADESINKTDLFYYLGLLELDAKHYQEALDFLQQALQHCQDNAILKARIQLYLGCSYAGLELLDQALDIFSQIDAVFQGIIVPFIEIAYRGLESCLARMVAEKYDVNQIRSSDDWTALFAAVKTDHFGCARLLLANRANPSLPSKEGNLALANAILYMNLEMAQLLLDHSEDSRADVRHANVLGISSIFLAAQQEEGHTLINFIQPYVDDWNVRDLQGATPLMQACVLGRELVARRLCELGADPNLRNWLDQSAVMFAAQTGHVNIVRMLIDEFAADYRITEKLSQSSLLDLAKQINHQELVDYFTLKGIESCETDTNPVEEKKFRDFLINFLKTQGMQVTSANAALVQPMSILPIIFEDEEMLNVMLVVSNLRFDVCLQFGVSALHLAVAKASMEMLEKILNIREINVDVLDCDDETPLHTAAQNNRADQMHLLIPRGAKINPQNKWLQTPLMRAASAGAVDALVALLGFYADATLVDEDGDTALSCAAVSLEEGCDDCIVKLAEHQSTLIDTENKKGLTALMYAILQGLINRMGLLISLGADVNKVSSVIHMTPLIFSLLKGKVEEAIFLMNCDGIDLNISDSDDDTALNIACQAGQFEVVQVLCLKFADLNKQNRFGRTPLMSALNQGYSEIVSFLLDNNPDLTCTDREGDTILHQAVRKNDLTLVVNISSKMTPESLNHCNHKGLTGLMLAALLGFFDVIKALLKQGADPDVQDNDGDTLLLTLLKISDVDDALLIDVIEKSGNLELQNFAGQSAILIATATKRERVVQLLLYKNVSLKVRDRDGNNLIAVAAIVGARVFVEQFINLGVTIDEPNRDGDTPLIMAALEGDFIVVSVLLALGAEINHANLEGATVLWHTVMRNHEELLDLFLDHGADVNMRNIMGSTPLMVAATLGYVNILKKLVQRTKDINAVNNLGINAVTLANMEQKTDAVHYLQSQGAVLQSLTDDHIDMVRRQALAETKKIAIHLIERGITAPMLADELNKRLLKEAFFLALQFDDTDTLGLFILLGMNVNVEHEGLKKTSLRIVTEKQSSALMRFCLENDADLLFVDSKGKTLLGQVVLSHEIEHCQFLLPFYSDLSDEIKENCLKICAEKILPQTKDLKKALLFYSTLSVIMPNSTHYHQNYACYLAAQANGLRTVSEDSLSADMKQTMEFSFQEAERQFKLAVGSAPTSSTWADYGNFLFGQGKGAEVLAVLHQARVLQDNGANSYSALELPNLDPYLRNAVNYYSEISLSPWILATWLLVQYHLTQGDAEEARKLLLEEQWQKPAKAHITMSVMLQGFGFYLIADYENALAQLNRFKLDRRSDQINAIIADCQQRMEFAQAAASVDVSANPQGFWATERTPQQFLAEYGYSVFLDQEAIDFYSVVYQQALLAGLAFPFERVEDFKAAIIDKIMTEHPEKLIQDENYLTNLDDARFSGDDFVVSLLPEILAFHIVILNADSRQPQLMKSADQRELMLVLGKIGEKYKLILQDPELTARGSLSEWVKAELQVRLVY